jgi:hypothetical protein
MNYEEFKKDVDYNINRMKREGHGYFFIRKVLKMVAKKHIGAEKEYLLMQINKSRLKNEW